MSTMIMEVNKETLLEGINRNAVALVEFGALWCPPCKVLLPLLEDIAVAYKGRVSMNKVDTDESPELASEYGVMANPTVVFFRNGEPVEKLVGLRPESVYRSVLDRLLQEV